MTITPVDTTTAAFVGKASSGPALQPTLVQSSGEYEQVFGAAAQDSPMSFAVQAFFQNGGRRALVVRVQRLSTGFFLCRLLRREPSELRTEDYAAAFAALSQAPYFPLLCLPGAVPAQTAGEAAALCEQRRAFLLLDPPPDWTSPAAAAANVTAIGAASRNAAVYYPLLRVGALENGASGAAAGVMARLDALRGVWKSPAGTEATLIGSMHPAQSLSQQEMELLNQAGINAIRALPDGGNVLWGARTLEASQPGSEWKYVSMRRTALMIEESIVQGTQWALHEENNEALWLKLRREVEDFLHRLWQQGALQGGRPQEAYFVRCDRTTMTQGDIDACRVIILVGMALIKPAEFVLTRIQQTARGS